MPTPTPEEPVALTIPAVAEVKYSLARMLAELKSERASSGFAMEKLDQEEISRLFRQGRHG